MKVSALIFLIVALFLNMCSNGNKYISPESDLISYSGRIGKTNIDRYKIYWPGSIIKIKVNKGTVTAFLSDDIGQTYYNVIIDGKQVKIIKPLGVKQPYILAEDLPNGEHIIELFRRTEYPTGTTSFYGFEVSQQTELLPINKPDLQMVFIGNSITTGYANENPYGNDRPDSIFTNNYSAYGAFVSRHFKADYQCIARGGIGFMVSWYDVIMPEIFNLTNPNDAATLYSPSKFDQRIVVINLGQNDSWIIPNPGFAEYKYRFGEQIIEGKDIEKAYRQFVLDVRSFYPNSHIICTLGSMDAVRDGSPWFDYIQDAVNEINDPHISTLKFPFLAAKTHPTVEDHQKMADILIQHIEQNVLH